MESVPFWHQLHHEKVHLDGTFYWLIISQPAFFLLLTDWDKAVEILWFWSKSGVSSYLYSWNSGDSGCLLQTDNVLVHEGSKFDFMVSSSYPWHYEVLSVKHILGIQFLLFSHHFFLSILVLFIFIISITLCTVNTY